MVFLTLVLCGCNWLLDPGGEDSARVNLRRELDRRQDLWTASEIHDYTFVYLRTCQCDTISLRDTVVVVADKVSRVADAAGADVTNRTDVHWPTVDSLFAWARVYTNDAHWTITVIFHDTYHFPYVIQADEPNAAKDAIAFTVPYFRSP